MAETCSVCAGEGETIQCSTCHEERPASEKAGATIGKQGRFEPICRRCLEVEV